MKYITLLSFALILCSQNLISQELYQDGYIVYNNGEKIQCLVKNEEWVDNPDQIQYKLSENDQVRKGSTDDLKEFAVGQAKFIRWTVDMDYSSTKTDKLSSKKEPEFKNETRFLRYLVEGEASLLTFKNSDLRRFFLSMNNEAPISLVYKIYKKPETGLTAKNTSFRRQLMQNIVCGDVTIDRLTQIRYNKNELRKVVNEYNECKGAESIVYKGEEGEKIKVRIALRPGIRLVNYETERSFNGSPTQSTFEKKPSFRVGAEFEFLLPGNNQRWAILLEPVFQKYEATGPRQREWNVTRGDAKVTYQSIEISFGVRHYFILSENSRLFINGLLTFDNPSSDSQVQTSNDFSIDSGTSSNLGFGYKYNNRFSGELRYGMKRDLLEQWNIANNHNFVSFIIGVNIL
ncbi:hypothetical protein [Ekhidna sp.]|uniref:hypothetical protein n=1 Tax=Ekhidna sp. TaxID=2608089 RepID=UPI003BA9EB1E